MFQFTQLIHIAAPHVSAETEKKINNYLIKSVASNMLQPVCELANVRRAQLPATEEIPVGQCWAGHLCGGFSLH
jgi:hypothetical protein